MVEIVNNNGQIAIESSITVDSSLVEVLINPTNKTRIKNILKELDLRHRMEEKEGYVVSIAARPVPNRFKIEEMPHVEAVHLKFLEQLEDMREKKPTECQQANADDEEEDLLSHAMLCAVHDIIEELGMIIIAVPKEK